MLGTDGTKALAPSRVRRLSARTSSRTPLHWGQAATSLLHVLAVKSHPDARIRLVRRGAGAVVHQCGGTPEPALRPGQPSALRCAYRGHRERGRRGGSCAGHRRGGGRHRQPGVGVQWSEASNSDDFAKNLIRARCEGRFGTSVLSPLGVVSCDLTA